MKMNTDTMLKVYANMLKVFMRATGKSRAEAHVLLKPIVLSILESELDAIGNKERK